MSAALGDDLPAGERESRELRLLPTMSLLLWRSVPGRATRQDHERQVTERVRKWRWASACGMLARSVTVRPARQARPPD